ncbi:MAG: DUF1611 domain-containing protein [Caulobacteraceae bacterium]|nr:DUF1611 domain-containing protein [Caulobacteraceae bacterium]
MRGRAGRLDSERLAEARKAFTTRNVDFRQARRLLTGVAPTAGDLVLARVEAVGHHTKLELASGRRAKLYSGDEIVVAYGARYAPDQFHADVPPSLDACDLIAGGGLAGRVIARHARAGRPTRIQPHGLLADADGAPLNLRRFALNCPPMAKRAVVAAVCGTSMNSGKTTTAASLVRGLKLAGLRVAGVKATGTGSGGDLWSMADAGARRVLDFTDMGHASTAGLPPEEILRVANGLIDLASEGGADVVVVEVADGLLQEETAALLSSRAFAARIDSLFFAAGEAMGALAGVQWLNKRNLPLVAVSGLVTCSPLGSAEAARATGVPVVGVEELENGLAAKLCLSVTDGARRAALG